MNNRLLTGKDIKELDRLQVRNYRLFQHSRALKRDGNPRETGTTGETLEQHESKFTFQLTLISPLYSLVRTEAHCCGLSAGRFHRTDHALDRRLAHTETYFKKKQYTFHKVLVRERKGAACHIPGNTR